MSSKRKADGAGPKEDGSAKKQRRRRSRSEPRNTGSKTGLQQLGALRGLFEWCTKHLNNPLSDEEYSELEEELLGYCEDPLLLDSVPESMDPEQLGFLLCAQESLRYLRENGMFRHTVYLELRSRFVQAMKDIGIA